MLDVSSVKSWVIMQMNAGKRKTQVRMINMSLLPSHVMRTVKKRKMRRRKQARIKVDPGTARNTEEPQGTPLMQSYESNIFTTGITSEWATSSIEDNLETPRVPSSVRSWIESSNHGEEEKNRNMINVPLAREKSMIEHRSSNISHPGENVAHAQPSVSHEEDEIQNSKF